jgi:perosamine synthetase
MILTDDARLAEKARSLRNLAFQPARRFYHEEFGTNFRLTNLQAALGVAQVERVDEIIARKRLLGHEYTQRLKEIEHLSLPVEEPWARSIYWMYGLVLSEEREMNGAQFAARLREHGVETRPFFLGMHEQPVFHRHGLFLNENYPVTERLARRGLYLPSGLALTEDQMTRVCDAVHVVLS